MVVIRYLLPLLGLLLFPSLSWADASTASFGVDLSGLDKSSPDEVASALQVLAVLTILSLAPALLIALTSFTRIVIVLSMLRYAFGMQQTPPNTVIIALALFLTLFTMTPVFNKIDQQALQPYLAGELVFTEAVNAGLAPMREFMVRQTREKDLALVIEMAGEESPETLNDISNTSLITAFMLSELQTAFQIGFVIFLPFLLIDLVSASVLMSMGMIMVPPLTISLPVKILMFVLIEGWTLVAQALVGSFN
ncbi:flagellar type III secretion system pore protein FliP [Hahella sp. NBU794]|uniref:flagellar type III secretion system pore protein FliP n=1 Tax=Hahella sp. NBU794 TaxID=3422590 RepID=UPI003D6E1929